MANKHTTLSGLFTAIADAIRVKNETTEPIVADNFPDAIAAISTGVELPVLSNPVTADLIPNGYEAVDGAGNLLSGTGAGLGDATAADVLTGKTFTSVNGLKLAGTSTAKAVVYGSQKGSGTHSMTIPALKGCTYFIIYCKDRISVSGQFTAFVYRNGTKTACFYSGELYWESGVDGTFDASTGALTGTGWTFNSSSTYYYFGF